MIFSRHILLFAIALLLSSCISEKEKRKQKETREWMEISEYLDREIRSRTLILEQNISQPEKFLLIPHDKRKEAYKYYRLLDSCLTTISTIQNELKYFYHKHHGIRTDISETEFFKTADTVLAHTIYWTINKLNDTEIKHYYLKEYLSDELKMITDNQDFFTTEYKNISIPLAIARLSQLKEDLLNYFYVLSDHKYRFFSHKSTDFTRLIPMVISRKDCIKIGENIDAEIFVGSFIYSSHIEMFCTKLSDSELKSKKEPLQKLEVENGRGKINLKANSTGTKFITGKILYTDFEGDTQEVKFIKEFTIIK